jgi:hypothetical protein
MVKNTVRALHYRKLTPRDILRWEDEYWVPPRLGLNRREVTTGGPATGSHHTVGCHPYAGTDYRRPIPR